MSNFRQVFGSHANEVIRNPAYRNWKSTVPDMPGYGIESVGPDKSGIVRTWRITPTPDYPRVPPTVVAIPEFRDDPCWRNGYLNYNQIPWGNALERRVTNPLIQLLQELFLKYRSGV